MPGVVQFDRQAPLPWQAIPRAGWSCPSWRETQGAPKWLASGLQPLETGEALRPKPGLRHSDQLAPNGHALFGPMARLPGDLGRGIPRRRAQPDLDRPGDLGGSDPWEDAESCQHGGSTLMS